RCQRPHQGLCLPTLQIDRHTDTEPEFCVVLEERIRPRGPTPATVDRVRGGWKVPAVNRRAAGGVCDERAISEQLRQESQVRRLATAGAGARELEERLQQLGALHGASAEPWVAMLGQVEEELPVGAFSRANRRLGHHVQRLVMRDYLAFDGAYFDTKAAPGAVLRCHLQGIAQCLQRLPLRNGRLERCRRAVEQCWVVDLRAEGRMRAHHHTFAALNAERLVPLGDRGCEVPLLPSRGARGKGSVRWKHAD